MGDVNGTCVFASVRGKGLYCESKYHYKQVCFFQKWCADKQRPLNTESYNRCPIREQEDEHGKEQC